MLKQIDREELRLKLAGPSRPVLVEALPEKYWRDWHLPGRRRLSRRQAGLDGSRISGGPRRGSGGVVRSFTPTLSGGQVCPRYFDAR